MEKIGSETLFTKYQTTEDMSDKFRMFDILDVDMGGSPGFVRPTERVHNVLYSLRTAKHDNLSLLQGAQNKS